MARMIPSIDPRLIENYGERMVYELMKMLPEEFTVAYSFKYMSKVGALLPFREADYVLIHPKLGVLVIEVKMGEVQFFKGEWQEQKGDKTNEMHKDPLEQVNSAMYALCDAAKKLYKNKIRIPFRTALCFPESSFIRGNLPMCLSESNLILLKDLIDEKTLESKIKIMFEGCIPEESNWTQAFLDSLIAPSFSTGASAEEEFAKLHMSMTKLMTEEQQRILEETELDCEKLFLGDAGTGKTVLAKAKAVQLAHQGKKVFLTCYNKMLSQVEFSNLNENITAYSFLDYIESVLTSTGTDTSRVKMELGEDKFYKEWIPEQGMEYFDAIKEEDRFDAIIIDEGQDFKKLWIEILKGIMLKKGGHFYIFADPRQNIFNDELSSMMNLTTSRHKLTRNLRNSGAIGTWMKGVFPDLNTRLTLEEGPPVVVHSWIDMEQERKILTAEIGRLVSKGVHLDRIMILSSHRKEKSCLSGYTKLKEWDIRPIGGNERHGIRFGTIRAAKGLEADIVFLIDIDEGNPHCTKADIYVGGSRARYILHVFQKK